MKRFTTFLLLTAMLSFGVTLLSHASTDKQVVKTDFGIHSDLLAVTTYDANYIAEATQEVVPDYAPNIIGKEMAGYANSVDHPPALNNKFLIKYSKRN